MMAGSDGHGGEIPAASLDSDHPPACRVEVEFGAATSVEEVWVKLQSTKSVDRRDWKAIIAAERINRMAWLAAEEAGTTRKKKDRGAAIAAMMGVSTSESESKPKTRKSRKAKVKVTDTDTDTDTDTEA